MRIRTGAFLVGASLALMACGDDPPSSDEETNVDGGATEAGSGDADSGARMANACGDPADPRATETCPGSHSPDGIASSLPECPECSDGICVPASMAQSSGQAAQLSQQGCSGNQLCAPKIRVACQGGGDFNKLLPKKCESFEGFEGRCISECIQQVSNQRDLLPQADCPDGKLCAPCYNPLTGNSLGACESTMCDAPDTEPEDNTFASCCNGEAMCIPADPFIPDEQESSLAQMGCASNQLCVPSDIAMVANPAAGVGAGGDAGTPDAGTAPNAPPTCRSINDNEGRCLSTCIPQVSEQQEFLPQEDCADGKLCAPCYNPITGDQTPACSQGDDMPQEEPQTFPSCCDGNASCIPTSFVPDDQESNLARKGCEQDELCVPNDLAAVASGGTSTPPTCTSVNDNEGRCVSTCIPQVAQQQQFLPQGDCADGKRCAPCFNPVNGEQTPACTQGDDAPEEDGKTFATCCSDAGSCIPQDLVPEANRDNLTTDTCGSSERCVPKEVALDQSHSFPSCTTGNGNDGGCLPECFVPDGTGATKEGCDTGELCIPCTDPSSGDPTGACGLGN